MAIATGIAFRARLPRQCDRQSGQALPLGIAFALVGMLGALVLFNTGQVAVDKQRLANAADSAAYSGMIWQARALNFQAYTNRAMVANQVSIGQAVSLNSWADYAERTAFHAENTLGNVPFVGPFVKTMAQVISQIAKVTSAASKGMIAVIGPINEAVGTAQHALYASTFAATPDIVRDIAKASDERFTADTSYSFLGLSQNLEGWRDFTQRYNEDEHKRDMTERTRLVNDSRDDFSRERYWDFFDSFWVYSTPFTKHKIFREGETHLVMTEKSGTPTWEWMAADTMSLQTRIWKGPFKGTDKVEVPMGWGAAYANEDGSSSKVLELCKHGGAPASSCRYARQNGRAVKWASWDIVSLDNYNGLQAFRSISESVRNPDEGEPVLKLKTEISMDIGDVQSSDRYIANKSPYDTPMISPGDILSSISAAEVYYRRPEAYKATTNSRKKLEPANGYNPYWDVRLAPVEAEDRLAALFMRGDIGSSSTLPGGAAAEALASYDPSDPDEEEPTTGGGASGTVPTASSGLPDFEGATLASVAGVSMADVNALVALAPDDFIEGSLAGFVDVSEIESQIRKSIEEKVETAAVEILTSAAKDALVKTTGADFVEDVEKIADKAVDAVGKAEELSQKFETLRVEVQKEFVEALAAEVVQYEGELAPIISEIGRLGGELSPIIEDIAGYENFSDVPSSLISERDRLKKEIAGLKEDKQKLLDGLKEDLTIYLIDRIEHHGSDLFEDRMPYDQIFDITEDLIDDYLDTPEELRGVDEVDVTKFLPWAEDADL